MLPYRFPLRWGAGAFVAPVVVVPSVETWGRITAAAGGWQLSAAAILPRFEHIYPQDSDIGWTKKGGP